MEFFLSICLLLKWNFFSICLASVCDLNRPHGLSIYHREHDDRNALTPGSARRGPSPLVSSTSAASSRLRPELHQNNHNHEPEQEQHALQARTHPVKWTRTHGQQAPSVRTLGPKGSRTSCTACSGSGLAMR